MISGRIKSGFVLCPRARILWMIVLVSIWVLIILLAGEDGRADGRKNLESESRVANNCYGVESAFCNLTVSIESFEYLCIKFPKWITIIYTLPLKIYLYRVEKRKEINK